MGEYFEKEDYTVGWICALAVELAAAKAFLDHRHPSLPQDEKDGNHYVFGRVGHHNVVMACLPAGIYGETSAATVAIDMHRSFPSIRVGLVVGIGGGVPQHDIRLGDIVVSEPGPEHGGVWPYDVGKTIQTGRFVHTGTSNKPPRSLLTALTELKSEHLRTGINPIIDIVNAALQNGFVSEEFVRPPSESDILFFADYDHSDDHLSCTECDISRIEAREPRTHNNPQIHYGLIASGNQVMKHGLTRSKLSHEKKVLCFEMEAAAVMDIIPSIVIRGICDYSDSHKNKKWQQYAALVAAAFAKQLLLLLPQSEDKGGYNGNRDGRIKVVLPIADGAAFGSFTDEHEPECLEGTRVDLLNQIIQWVDNPMGKPIFWLVGMAGTGKSTVSRTVARLLQNKGQLGASFFFKRTEVDRSSAVLLFSTIATQLADHFPRIASSILRAIEADTLLPRKALREQFEKLVLQPLSSLSPRIPPTKIVVIIDALDECERKDNVRLIIYLLSRFKEIKNILDVRVFITSRPNLPIRPTFQRLPKELYDDILLHNVPKIEHDISLYLKHELTYIREEHCLSADWPGDQRFQKLVDLATPLFIHAATMCRFIGDDLWTPDSRLEMILEQRTEWNASQLDKIYLPVLNQLLIGQTAKEQDILIGEFHKIIGSIINLAVPLSVSALAHLLFVKEELVECRLKPLQAVLNVPDGRHLPVRTLHLSFRDFLVDPNSQGNFPFWVNEQETHRMIADSCLQLMSVPAGLKRDICNVGYPGILRSEISQDLVEKCMPSELQYACRYWIFHLHRGGGKIIDDGHTHLFLKQHLLHWLEASSLLYDVQNIIKTLSILISIIDVENGKNVFNFVHDIDRFVRQNHHIIATSPLQTYVSAIIFAPNHSTIRRMFDPRLTIPWITHLPCVQDNWDAHLQTLEGHTGYVQSIAFSPDGKILASASSEIKLWDKISGALMQTLEDHTDPVNTIIFSPDGKIIASGSYDKTVKLWEVTTGIVLQTLKGHTDSINTIAFSPEGKTLASGSDDETIKLWDTSGALLHTLEGHMSSINALVFSPDGKTIASGAYDKTVKLWEAATGIVLQTLEGHTDSIETIVFSPDGKFLVSASSDSTITLWNTDSRALLYTLKGHMSIIDVVVFSPDGKTLASSSRDETVKLWDPVLGALIHTLDGHTDWIEALTFSPKGEILASGSRDMTVRLWDATSGAPLRTLEGHMGEVMALAFSPDGKTLASASWDKTVILWDAALKTPAKIFERRTSPVTAMTFSPDGRTLTSILKDGTAELWDTPSGTLVQTLESTLSVKAVAFSPDCKTLALAFWNGLGKVTLWNVTWETSSQTLDGHMDAVETIAFSSDGKILASGSGDTTVILWDIISGMVLQKLEGHAESVTIVTFSPTDGKILASASDDWTIRLWDTDLGLTLKVLKECTSWITALAFSPDSITVASGSQDYTLRVWDVNSGTLQWTLENLDTTDAIAFSPDGMTLAASCRLGTVSLWNASSKALMQSFNFSGVGKDKITFSPDSRYLYCPQEVFLLSLDVSQDSNSTIKPGVYIEGEWLGIAGQRLVRLSHARRPVESSFHKSLVALGHASGNVSFIGLADDIDITTVI